MAQIKLLCIVVAAFSMPLASNSQDDLASCAFAVVTTSGLGLADPAAIATPIYDKCCPGSVDPTCTLMACLDLESETMGLKEPCTCGEAIEALKAMMEGSLGTQINMFFPALGSQSSAAYEACCSSEATTATEFNNCLADGTSAEVVVVGSTGATGAPTDVTTTIATEAVETTATATKPNPTAASTPSSASLTSVSLPIMVAYAFLNYIM